MIKAIETIYNGYRFRSRLEARWAVFFDAMGIEYEYEPEGYELDDGTYYLPDFRIWVNWRQSPDDQEDVYVEVKGVMTDEDLNKIVQLSKYAPVIILQDIPKDEAEWCKLADQSGYNYYSFLYMDGDYYAAYFSQHEGYPWITGADHEQWDHGKQMNEALIKARQARFEHGE